MISKSVCFILVVLIGCLLAWACNKGGSANEPLAPASSIGQLRLVFDNVVGDQDLKLRSKTYMNSASEPFTVTMLNYFISNIRLKKANGSEYIVPPDSSYFLVKESDATSQTITLRNVPLGEYTGLTYLIGVDSLRNTMNISKRVGVLDPAENGMYWDWNSGYIFFKLEGTSPAAPADATGTNFRYHIGFFGGYSTRTINNLRTVSLVFGPSAARVSKDKTPQIRVKADMLRVFDGPIKISIAVNPDIMVSPLSSSVADNYARMFTFSSVE